MSNRYQFSVKVFSKPLYQYILWPLASIVKLLKITYDWLIHLIWSELIKKEKEDSLTGIIAFIIISVFAVFMYKYQKYDDIIVISLFGIWFLDYFLAKYQRQNSQQYKNIVLEKNDNSILWKTKLHKENSLRFDVDEIKYVGISKREIIAGAFSSKIGDVWSVAIYLKNGVDLIIAEETEAHKAFLQAKKIESWGINIKFLDSEGNSEYAVFSTKPYKQSSLIEKNINGQQTNIRYRWRLSYLGALLYQLCSKVGFLLFVCILSNILVHYGLLVYTTVCPIFNLPKPYVYVELSKIWQLFIPQGDPKDIVEGVVIFILLVYNARLITISKTVQIEKNTVSINAPTPKNISKLKFVLFVTKPEHTLLFCSENNIIELKHLQSADDYRSLLSEIEKENVLGRADI